ncbi:UNVERIFIED_CONTAM: hypothetical protein K2H54_057579 [Gekko kuhli]
MSADKEPIIPVTTGETTPVTTGTEATLSEEGAGGSSEVPYPFGGATARIITRLKGPRWGRISWDSKAEGRLHPKEGVRNQEMKQGLCLKCGEPGHFTTTCPGSSVVKKSPEKVHPDTPAQKPTIHPKPQRALQMSDTEEDPGLSKDNKDEPVGKGQDLL